MLAEFSDKQLDEDKTLGITIVANFTKIDV